MLRTIRNTKIAGAAPTQRAAADANSPFPIRSFLSDTIPRFCACKAFVNRKKRKSGRKKGGAGNSKKGLTKKIIYDTILRSDTEGYRSGHNEAVLKPPCHSGSNQRKSPVFEGNTRTFRTAKFFLLMFFLIQFHSSVYTEGYRSGHNEAVLKPPCHSESNRRKSPVFTGNMRTFRTAKFFLLMFFLIQFHSSVYTEGYRSGHNEAVLKTV